MPTIEKTHCPGSGTLIPRKGYKTKQVRYATKYECPECGGFFAMTTGRKLNKHGYALRAGGERIDTFSYCAECGDKLVGVDYLCEKCREAS